MDSRVSPKRRRRLIATIALCTIAGVCWALSAQRMAGMDAGPTGQLGPLGWFMATWIVMMAAMMLPVVAPAAADAAPRAPVRSGLGAGLFAGAYLIVWAVAGLAAYGLISAGRHLTAGALAWEDGGRWAAGLALVAAAGYQLSRHKRRALHRCRQTHGSHGAFAGLRAGLSCMGSSWAMMAALFALGVMSVWWMAVVATLIAAERLPRRATPGRLAAAVVLAVLGLGLMAAPKEVPGLTIPGSPPAMKAMMRMAPSPPMRESTGGMSSRTDTMR